tara:strand:- start:1 stop:519 length:519 start_codon:yes stop_codon:yes gene_type:complete
MNFDNNKKYLGRKKNWKQWGVLDDFNNDYKTLFRIYMSTKFCDTCGIGLIEGNYGTNKKCLDHCHTSDYFRGVLCTGCNTRNGRTRIESIENNKLYNKSYRLENKDKASEYMKEYKLKNKEHLKEYRLKNKDKLTKQSKNHYLKNKDRMKKQSVERYHWKKIQKEFLNIYTE